MFLPRQINLFHFEYLEVLQGKYDDKVKHETLTITE